MAKEVPKNSIISYVGLEGLEDDDKEAIMELTEKYFPKIQRLVKNIMELIVHIKRHDKEGHRTKWDTHVRLEAPGHVFDSTKASEWELNVSLHKAFQDVESQIQHRYHTEYSSGIRPMNKGRSPMK